MNDGSTINCKRNDATGWSKRTASGIAGGIASATGCGLRHAPLMKYTSGRLVGVSLECLTGKRVANA
jgi:hypothetical protein